MKFAHFSRLLESIKQMGGGGDTFKPDRMVAEYHEKKFKVFLEMVKDQEKYRRIMEDGIRSMKQ